MVVEGWLNRAARLRPGHTALQTPLGSWSYAELLAAARLGADELTARGVRRSQRVAIALPAGLAFAQALHACLLLGAVAVPLDPRSPPAERARVAEGAALLLEAPLGAPDDGASGAGEGASGAGEGTPAGSTEGGEVPPGQRRGTTSMRRPS